MEILQEMSMFKASMHDKIAKQSEYRSLLASMQPNTSMQEVPWVDWQPPIREAELHWDVLPLHSLTTQHILLDTRGLYVSTLPIGKARKDPLSQGKIESTIPWLVTNMSCKALECKR